MRLSFAEIRQRAIQFGHDWKDETSERAEAQTFWNEYGPPAMPKSSLDAHKSDAAVDKCYRPALSYSCNSSSVLTSQPCRKPLPQPPQRML
jgi:hypothetical protein